MCNGSASVNLSVYFLVLYSDFLFFRLIIYFWRRVGRLDSIIVPKRIYAVLFSKVFDWVEWSGHSSFTAGPVCVGMGLGLGIASITAMVYLPT